MRPTEILMNEHRVIEQVLDCLEKMAILGEQEGRIDAAPARDAVEFFRGFADGCHHGKEEDRLFPLVETRGFSAEEGPTAVMRIEHDEGRSLVGRIEHAIDGAADGRANELREFIGAAHTYVSLLREHIMKEDHCLFPMAERALSAEDQQKLVESFEQAERVDAGSGDHERFLRIADELATRFGVPRSRTQKV